jgi:hypothetical protein
MPSAASNAFSSVSNLYKSARDEITKLNESRRLRNEQSKYWSEADKEKRERKAQQQKEDEIYRKEIEQKRKDEIKNRAIWKKEAYELERKEFEDRKRRHDEYFRKQFAEENMQNSLRNAALTETNRQYTRSLKGHRGGGSKSKEILGKIRRVYKVAGSRKEHIKYKGELIPVSDYKKLFKKQVKLK